MTLDAAAVGQISFAVAVRMALIFAAARLLSRFTRSLTAEHRHTIWLAVLVAFAVLPGAQLALPVVHVPLFGPAPRLPANQPPGLVSGSDSFRAPSAAPRQGSYSVPAADGPLDGRASWILLALAGIWAAGALGIAARLVSGRVILGRIMRSKLRSPGPGTALRELERKAGLAGVRVIAHPRVTIPFTFGVLHPTIVLPHTWDTWERSRLKAVLLHELAHVRRRDALSSTLALLACAVGWFNPLAWMARAMMIREAELCCDREVLSHGIPGSEYASAIVGIFKGTGGAPLRVFASALGNARALLTERITHILFPQRAVQFRRRRSRGLLMAALLIAPLFLLSLSFRGTEKLYGVWQTVDPQRLSGACGYSWHDDGTAFQTLSVLPDVSAARCRYTIDARWTDAQGYTWYHIRAFWSGMPFTLYTLIRLNPAGNRYELIDSPLGYPAGFLGPPGDEKHQVYARM